MTTPTQTELQVVAQFRKNLSDLNLQGFRNTDLGLLQWLRARELNIAKAEEMLRKSLKFRQENDLDSILTGWKRPSQLVDMCPWQFLGHDKEGCPVAFIEYGAWDLRKIFNAGFETEYPKFVYQMHEMMTDKMKNRLTPSGQPVSQFTMIADVSGMSMRSFASIGAVRMAMTTSQSIEANYPEVLKAVIVFNASKVFVNFFALIKPILSQRTFAKMAILGSQVEIWRKAILEHVTEDQLPQKIVEKWNPPSPSNDECERPNNLIVKNDLDEFREVRVPPGDKICINFEVNGTSSAKKSDLQWWFETKDYDIGFSLSLGSKTVVPYRKVNSHQTMEEGSIPCEEGGGIYSFLFDNSYSRMRGKVLKYRIITTLQNLE